MSNTTNQEVLAISMHVAAASALVAQQSQLRMETLTQSVLQSVELCRRIAQNQMENHQHNQLINNENCLQIVIEEQEEDMTKYSNTKQEIIITENQEDTQAQIQEENQQQLSFTNFITLSPPPQQRMSFLQQQLSQIKVDKEKEAQDDEALLKLVEETDPESLIPKMTQVEVYDEKIQQSIKKDALVFQDKEVYIIEQHDENEQNQENLNPNSPHWSYSSEVQYRATSYNTNESSNLDHHSYQWASDKEQKGDDELLLDNDFGFGYSVFDFPFPAGFNENSIPFQPTKLQENQQTPKKKRLYCNNKKIPHWAEDLNVVSQRQINQKNLHPDAIFGKMGNKVLEIAKVFTDKKNKRRGSSARWDLSQMKYEKMAKENKLQREFQELANMQKENAMSMHKRNQEALKNLTIIEKTQNLINNFKDRIFSSKKKGHI